ncbi:MAG: class I SAM-dependent methyltransferase [Planctomycetota bacterium]
MKQAKPLLSELDRPEVTIEHRTIIQRKPFLRNTYLDFYQFFKEASTRLPPGLMFELGSGGGILKEVFPEVFTSDILVLPMVDICFSAEEMPFASHSISALFLFNVLHHIKKVEIFFDEASRCLKKGGKIVMIEPANTFLSYWIYRYFHHEPFRPEGNWEIPEGGPLSGANGALPWIVFVRDKKQFQQRFPDLKIERIILHTPFRYLIGGGFSLPQLLPSFLYSSVRSLEAALEPLNPWIGLFMTIEVTRK